MSWLFSRVLVAEYSAVTCSDGEQSALSSGNHTQHAFLPSDRMTAFSRPFRFGMTFAPLTDDLGAALLMWFLAVSRARTSASQVKESASLARDQVCGPTWRASLAKYDPISCSWKTAQLSLLGDSESSSVIWPRSGMTAAGQCWELPMLEPITSATGSGLWPTPLANSHTGAGHGPNKTGSPNLQTAVKAWPTPTSSLGTNGGRVTPRKAREGGTLIEALSARTFATPTARDWKSGKASQTTMERNSRPLSEQIGGLLNPVWVEWLMGWPLGWTDLEPLATAKYQHAQPLHGEFLQKDETC